MSNASAQKLVHFDTCSLVNWHTVLRWMLQMSSYFMTLCFWTLYRSHWDRFSQKSLKNWKKQEIQFWHKRDLWIFFKWFFFLNKPYFFNLYLNSTCSQLSFDVHNIHFAQIFQIFNFFAIRFSSMTNFIPPPLAAQKIVKRYLFWYLWTSQVQNIYLKINFMHYEVI